MDHVISYMSRGLESFQKEAASGKYAKLSDAMESKIEITGFEVKDMVYMANYTLNGKEMQSPIWEQDGMIYINTGSKITKDLERHFFTKEQTLAYNNFVNKIQINEQSKNIHINGYKGTYSVIKSDIIDGQKAYLLKSDIESDEMEISDIVCDEKGNVLLDEVWTDGLYEYKSNIFYDRKELSQDILRKWEVENDTKISHEQDLMIYNLSHDHSLTKERFEEMVYDVINNGHKLELNTYDAAIEEAMQVAEVPEMEFEIEM